MTGWYLSPCSSFLPTASTDREQAARRDRVHSSRGLASSLFLIRTRHAELEYERAIAHLLGAEQPIVSVAPLRGKALEDLPSDAHEWADVALPRLLDPAGAPPRRIGGWSFGDVLAYEVAQRLARR